MMTLATRIEEVEKAFPVLTREAVDWANPELPKSARELLSRLQAPKRHVSRVNLAQAMIGAVTDELMDGLEASPETEMAATGLRMLLPLAALQGVGGPMNLGRFPYLFLHNGESLSVGGDRCSARLWPFSRCGKGRSGATDGPAWDSVFKGIAFSPDMPSLHPAHFALALDAIVSWVQASPDGECTDTMTREKWAWQFVDHLGAIAGRLFLEDSQGNKRLMWAMCYEQSQQSQGWTKHPDPNDPGLPYDLMHPHVKDLVRRCLALWNQEQEASRVDSQAVVDVWRQA